MMTTLASLAIVGAFATLALGCWAYSEMARFRRKSFEIKYRDTLLILPHRATAGTGHPPSQEGKSVVVAARPTWPVKDAYPETNS